ncbi:hypothetical protein [Acinetobacter sp. GXMZU3951]
MFKIIVLFVLGMVLTAAWQIFKKMRKTQKYRTQYLAKTQTQNLMVDDPALDQVEGLVIEIEYYEQVLFDDAAQLFFEQNIHIRDLQRAEEIQHNLLKKLPAKTLTQIRQLDLNEWSIYWHFYDQSLEYYVGKYGVFCSHVDRHGEEHKCETTLNPQDR